MHIESAVDQAVHLNDKSKNTFRGRCKRVTHARVLPIYADVLKFSERVIADRAQRRIRDPRMPTVQHVLLDLCKRTIDENWKPSAQVMNGIVAVYNAHGVYP